MSNLSENLLKIMWEQSFALSNQLEKYKVNTYPTEELRIFIEEITEINIKFLGLFSQNPQTINHSELKAYSDIFRFFQENIVKSIAQSNITNHPLEVMIPVREIVKLIGGDSNFITEPSWELNYAIGDLWSTFANATNRIGLTNLQIEKRIVIQFPTLHKENVLLGSIMGHELGHYLDLHHGLNITEQLLPQMLNHPTIDKLIPYLKGNNNQNLDPNILRMIVKSVLSNSFLVNWLKEFVADISGILLYGPASHFSCEQIFMFFGVSDGTALSDGFSNTHPRNYIRSVVRRKTLSYLSYDELFPDRIQNVMDSWHTGWESSTISNINLTYKDTFFNQFIFEFTFNNESCKLIESILIDNIDNIIKMVIDTIPKEIHYDSAKINEWVNPLSGKLSKLIPPNELKGQPADSISILNAGWFAYYLYGDAIKRERGLQTFEGDLELRETLNNLIRKALISANIHRRWIDVSTVR
ncbi:M48 family metalloprotease [Bacillus infantis]|uniref:M48 family metalloprotease n=1 Tax=Bacillus infantis TaxID=324767 RepID=UPI002FBEA1EF